MEFQFVTAGKIVFGRGAFARLPELCAPLGRSWLVVSDAALGQLADRLCDALERKGLGVTPFPRVSGEPTVELVEAALSLARERGCDAAVGLGGGSSIDTAKAAAAMLHNEGNLVDYLEGVGTGRTQIGRAHV
jgi:alcohol dehydrogenase class IV